MRTRSVLHITPYLAPAWAHGPVPAAVWTLATAQAGRGWHVSVLTTDAVAPHERVPAGSSNVNGVHVVRVRNAVGLITSWMQISTPVGWTRAARALLAQPPRIVHLHELRSLEARLIAPLVPAGTVLLASTHGYESQVQMPLSSRARMQERLLRPAWSRIDRVLVDSALEREAVLRLAARNRLSWSDANLSVTTPGEPAGTDLMSLYEDVFARARV